MMEIERPKIETAALSPDGRYGKFVVEPLERGFGTTLGNSLRRVLLSSLPGVAVTSVKIDGVVHEFTTIEGVREDVTEIVLNLKGIAAKIYGEAPKTVRVEAVGPCEVTAGTIKGGDDLEILNPEWHIATLGEGAKLVMELTFDKGRGYVPAEKNKQALIEKNDISTLPVDSIYTPVLKVNYTVDRTRVGQITDFDKLIMEVWTDGTCNAQEALSLAARVLTEHLNLFVNLCDETGETEIMVDNDDQGREKALEMTIEELGRDDEGPQPGPQVSRRGHGKAGQPWFLSDQGRRKLTPRDTRILLIRSESKCPVPVNSVVPPTAATLCCALW